MQQNQRISFGSTESPPSPQSQHFLSVSVTDPVKVGNGVQAYISYKVITKTNLPEYQEPEKIVVRRYNDFVWLHDRLFERYKGIFVPLLPEKSAVEKFRFSAEFIEMRCRRLDAFINRIASHHELRQSDDLRLFLQAHEDKASFGEKKRSNLWCLAHYNQAHASLPEGLIAESGALIQNAWVASIVENKFHLIVGHLEAQQGAGSWLVDMHGLDDIIFKSYIFADIENVPLVTVIRESTSSFVEKI